MHITNLAPSMADNIAVDLGKTKCRVRITSGGTTHEFVGSGAPGFASHHGEKWAFDAIERVLDAVSPAMLTGVEALGVGAAGGDSDDVGVRSVAERAARRWGWDVAIASDVVTAHIGAFAGSPGTILIAGTGAVAGHVTDDGTWVRSDGWGPWLGDDGSGRWIGQKGLIAALRGADGRGPGTALEEDARAIAPDLLSMPQLLTGGPDVARSLASFAPTVLRRARQGDFRANQIVAGAVDHLVATAKSVTPAGGSVSVVGGLTEDPGFARRLMTGLEEVGLTVQPPLGTSLDGAAMLATHRDLLHERYAIRDAAHHAR
jgi:glucosamine kinase